MSGKNRKDEVRAILSVAVAMLASGCASTIEGSDAPPFDWVAESPSSQCTALAGSYSAAGMPAPANANTVHYGAVWAKEGSLLSIIELGSNATPRNRPRPDPSVKPDDVVPSITIATDSTGRPEFAARNAHGGTEKLKSPMWTCEHGTMTSLVTLSTPGYESQVRLWKHGSALIAEQTVLAGNTDSAGVRAREAVARFYFRFPSITD